MLKNKMDTESFIMVRINNVVPCIVRLGLKGFLKISINFVYRISSLSIMSDVKNLSSKLDNALTCITYSQNNSFSSSFTIVNV